jgi:hypothetical protein
MKSIDLSKLEKEISNKLRFKAYLNGSGNIVDYLNTLIVNDPMKMRSPKKQYCFECHTEQIFVPTMVKDEFVIKVDEIDYSITVPDFPMDRCNQCGTAYMSVSLGAAFEEIIIEMISNNKEKGIAIPEVISLQEWLYDLRTRENIEEELITFKKSDLAKLILSYGEKMDFAESKNDQISIVAKMELLNRLIHSKGSDLND